MNFGSKKTSLLILAITSVACSKAFFLALNDPEGPNLLIHAVLAGIIFFISLAAYAFNRSVADHKRLLLAILIQIVLVAGLIFFLI